MPIGSLIADPTTQAEVDYRRERAIRQYGRASRPVKRWRFRHGSGTTARR